MMVTERVTREDLLLIITNAWLAQLMRAAADGARPTLQLAIASHLR